MQNRQTGGPGNGPSGGKGDRASYSRAEPQQYRVANKGRRKGVFIAVLAALLVIGGVLFAATRISGGLQKNSVDLTDYILTPKAVGLDGAGEILEESVKWNEEGLQRAINETHGKVSNEESEKVSDEVNDDPSLDVADIVNTFELVIDKTDKLSNGDEVTVSIEYHDQEALEDNYGVKFLGNQRVFPISGLQELIEKSPFEGISLNVEGISPYATLTVEQKAGADTQYVSANNYDVFINGEEADNRQVKIGDEVRITLNDEGVEDWNSNGLNPTETEFLKTIKSEDVESYVQSYADLTEQTLDYIEREADDLMTQKLAQRDGGTYEYFGYYFLQPKDNKWLKERTDTPILFRIYEINEPDSAEIAFGVVAVSGLINSKYPSDAKPVSQITEDLEFEAQNTYPSVAEIVRKFIDSNAATFEVESTDLE